MVAAVAGWAQGGAGVASASRRRHPLQGRQCPDALGRSHGEGYSCPLWLTYKQASELGGQVRKGEKGSLVVYANRINKTATDDKGADVEIEIPFMKGYTVFNAEQIDGLPAHFYATVQPINNAIERLDAVERFFANTGATIKHGGNRAFYSPSLDFVQMPELGSFRDAESYYATRAHEMIHWTRAESR